MATRIIPCTQTYNFSSNVPWIWQNLLCKYSKSYYFKCICFKSGIVLMWLLPGRSRSSWLNTRHRWRYWIFPGCLWSSQIWRCSHQRWQDSKWGSLSTEVMLAVCTGQTSLNCCRTRTANLQRRRQAAHSVNTFSKSTYTLRYVDWKRIEQYIVVWSIGKYCSTFG